MKNDQKVEDKIAAMEAEIDRQRSFCQKSIYPYVKIIVEQSLLRTPHPLWMIVHSHKGIRMTIRKYRVKIRGRRRYKKRVQVNIWYKFRKVLEYRLSRDGDTFCKLNVFHACEWVDNFGEFLTYVEDKFAKEDLKTEERRLKYSLKKVKSNCDKYESYCKDE